MPSMATKVFIGAGRTVWGKMRSVYIGKVKETRITKSAKFFHLYIELFNGYFEIIL